MIRGVNAILDKKGYSPLTYHMNIRTQDNLLVRGAEEKDACDNSISDGTRLILREK
jgi:hypothetical protein